VFALRSIREPSGWVQPQTFYLPQRLIVQQRSELLLFCEYLQAITLWSVNDSDIRAPSLIDT
jgi:hypothetical protein